MKSILLFFLITLSALVRAELIPPPDDGKLRIICFGAHPDDCELRAGGVAAMWAERGHHVLFVSVSNGDIGHWRESGGALARRRQAEVDAAHQHLGIQGKILDIHDGEVMPTLENRRTITRLIREWKADVVLTHRPNDYHPDHRYTAILVQDAAFMVAVPHFCPDVPHLKKNPAFFYFADGFQKPAPFNPDVVVGIDAVMEKKLAALAELESQFYEGGALGSAELMPSDPEKQKTRRAMVRDTHARRYQNVADKFRARLADRYPAEEVGKIIHAEAFELCEYGSKPDKAEVKRLFPFFAPATDNTGSGR